MYLGNFYFIDWNDLLLVLFFCMMCVFGLLGIIWRGGRVVECI